MLLCAITYYYTLLYNRVYQNTQSTDNRHPSVSYIYSRCVKSSRKTRVSDIYCSVSYRRSSSLHQSVHCLLSSAFLLYLPVQVQLAVLCKLGWSRIGMPSPCLWCCASPLQEAWAACIHHTILQLTTLCNLSRSRIGMLMVAHLPCLWCSLYYVI